MSVETPQNVAPAPAQLEPAFIFDHLPKTGGTALRLVFEQIFGPDQVSPSVLSRTERWAEKNFSRYRMIVGHFHCPIPHTGRAEKRVRLTILRNPLDRAISEYFYYRNDVEKLPWHNLALYSKDHDLYAYTNLLEAQGNIAVSNRFAHHFAEQLSRGPWRESRLLSLAKEALADYDFVGVQEQLADSVDLFCSKYDLPAITKIPRANVTSARMALGELDARTRDRLVRLNRVDLELYEFARSRFQDWKRTIYRRYAKRAAPENEAGERDKPGLASSSGALAAAASSNSFGDQAVEFCRVRTFGSSDGNGVTRSGESLIVRLAIAAHIDVPDLTIGLQIVDDVGEVVFGTNTFLLGESRPVSAGKNYEVSFVLKADIRPGRYTIGGSLHTGASHTDRCFHWCEQLTSFDVIEGATPFVGYCRLGTEVEWTEGSATTATG